MAPVGIYSGEYDAYGILSKIDERAEPVQNNCEIFEVAGDPQISSLIDIKPSNKPFDSAPVQHIIYNMTKHYASWMEYKYIHPDILADIMCKNIIEQLNHQKYIPIFTNTKQHTICIQQLFYYEVFSWDFLNKFFKPKFLSYKFEYLMTITVGIEVKND
ncbi:MAG: hypothetical protein ACFFDY_00115 [Candidatus Thorarchaeota archaeon]